MTLEQLLNLTADCTEVEVLMGELYVKGSTESILAFVSDGTLKQEVDEINVEDDVLRVWLK